MVANYENKLSPALDVNYFDKREEVTWSSRKCYLIKALDILISINHTTLSGLEYTDPTKEIYWVWNQIAFEDEDPVLET